MTAPVESVSFCIFGQPVPKGRPRFVRGRAVTPKRTRDYEALVRNVAALHCGHWRRDGLYRVTLDFVSERHLRGDVDNYAKALLDGMEGHAFDNDRQVTEVFARKHASGVSAAFGPPLAKVLVERIGDAPVKRRAAVRVSTAVPVSGGVMHVHGERKPNARDLRAFKALGEAAAAHIRGGRAVR